MKAQLLTMSTPDGPFTIIARDGAVLASGWTAVPGELTGQIHADLLPGEFETVAGLGAISAAVEAFYAGNPGPAMGVPVLQKSGPFRGHAWDVLRTVAPGHPVTYTEYAELSGNAKAVRAAASACAFNAAALFVPCHRVIRTDGTLGGFRWGLAIKESLLDRERRAGAAPDRAEVRLRAHVRGGRSAAADVSPRRRCQRVTGTPAGQGSSSGRSTPSAAAVARRLPRVGVRPASQAAMSVSIPLITVDRAAGRADGHRRQAERLEHEPLPFRHPGGQESRRGARRTAGSRFPGRGPCRGRSRG